MGYPELPCGKWVFTYPDTMAVFSFWIMGVTLGLGLLHRRGWRLGVAVVGLIRSLAVFWAYSRATLLALLSAFAVFGLLVSLERRSAFSIAGITGLLPMRASLVFLTLRYGADLVLSGRLGLWQQSLSVSASDPRFLLFGHLCIPPPKLPVFWFAHNIYLLGLITYGLPGALLLVLLAFSLLSEGWNRYQVVRNHPFLRRSGLVLLGSTLWRGWPSLT